MVDPGLHDAAAAIRGLTRDRLQFEIVARLCAWIESREEQSGLHVLRVLSIAVETGREMGIEPGDLSLLALAAPLHDIGKLLVPDRILLKTDRLDDLEWKLVKEHAALGAKMLEGSLDAELDAIAAAVRGHHEKWDGTGYPAGLAGEEIPLPARIFAVIDVWDALRHDRPYRRAWDAGRARALIEQESGRHFDPQVVRAFLAWLDETGDAEAIHRPAGDPVGLTDRPDRRGP